MTVQIRHILVAQLGQKKKEENVANLSWRLSGRVPVLGMYYVGNKIKKKKQCWFHSLVIFLLFSQVGFSGSMDFFFWPLLK